MIKLIDKLEATQSLSKEEWVELIDNRDKDSSEYLFEKARKIRHEIYENDVYIRGLIEFSNYCENDCFYCGIRRNNPYAQRYRLGKDEIMSCCKEGYELGFRTFVLQSGEDSYYTDDIMTEIISSIKEKYPDCAVTLSIGEKSKETYQKYFDAGADRYLLRHETACDVHYKKLHPPSLSLSNRKQCLFDLKEIGFQVGSGFMVGSPFQTSETLADDMLFLKELNPHMVGVGPFIPHHDTPFKGYPQGSVELTLFMIGLIRLMLPNALIPATTALGTLDTLGREKGIQAGANVVMPNLSPKDVRKKYLLYDNKICTGDEAAECRYCMQNRMKSIGYDVVVSRGDCKNINLRESLPDLKERK
ncbi:MAG: [FeFe] hydrogenase H-cluster radical SAM maturase HydE [Bacillota bacterium]|nr:[FeFe] hydrogenase H-cluster radical SAM maturase HydE [Bacillota bacterium]